MPGRGRYIASSNCMGSENHSLFCFIKLLRVFSHPLRVHVLMNIAYVQVVSILLVAGACIDDHFSTEIDFVPLPISFVLCTLKADNLAEVSIYFYHQIYKTKER